MSINIQTINAALQKSWSAETSSADDWNSDNPSIGQCAVTACVVQDYFGGDIVNSIAKLPNGDIISHYLNLIGGKYIDLTSQQFNEGVIFSNPMSKKKSFSSTREYCLSYVDTNDRYEILKAKVAKCINCVDCSNFVKSIDYIEFS